MTAHCMAIEASSSLTMVVGTCSGHTSKVEKHVAASIHNRVCNLVCDVLSDVEPIFMHTSPIHRYDTVRASRSSRHARRETPTSVVEAKRRLQIRADTDETRMGVRKN